jgi:hypothetical protein
MLSNDGSANVADVGDGSAAAVGVSGCSSGGLGVTCSSLCSVEDGVEAAGDSWLDEPGLSFTCGCLSSEESLGQRWVVKILPAAVCPLWRMV